MHQRDFLHSQFDSFWALDSNTQILFLFPPQESPFLTAQLLAINLHLPTKCFELRADLPYHCGCIYSNRLGYEYLADLADPPDPAVYSVILISFWLLAFKSRDDLLELPMPLPLPIWLANSGLNSFQRWNCLFRDRKRTSHRKTPWSWFWS